jgi:phosphoribosyl 1,2-cyclic phosphodiesterase
MKLRFLGTRGEIEARTKRHARHSSLLVSYGSSAVAVDWGLDWQGRLDEVRPGAIVLTHAHPDHAGGLRDGARCPVYATPETWGAIRRFEIERRGTVQPRRAITVRGISFEAFPVEHSLRAPAVAYRIAAGHVAVLYAPDVVSIPKRRAAMNGISLYVGDGASLARSIVRRREGVLIGHASIREQLDWCAAEGVGRALFSHCGSQIVKDEQGAAAKVAALGAERGVEAAVAYDGLERVLR